MALRGKQERFCTRLCADNRNNRQKRRGVQLWNLFAETRKNRRGGRGIGDMNTLAALWFAEDAAAGRVSHHPELVPPQVKVWRQR